MFLLTINYNHLNHYNHLLFRAIVGGILFSAIFERLRLHLHHSQYPKWPTYNFLMLWIICNIIKLIQITLAIFSLLRREIPIRKDRLLSVIGYVFSLFWILACVICEAWIFTSIFVSYSIIGVIKDDTIQFCSLVVHFIFQMLFLMESNACHKKHSSTLKLRVHFSGICNLVMLTQVVTTIIYNLWDIFKNSSTAISYINFPVVLYLVELFYRGYAAWCYYLFYHSSHAGSLTTEHTNESVMEYERSYDRARVAGFGSRLQFVTTENFSAAK